MCEGLVAAAVEILSGIIAVGTPETSGHELPHIMVL